MIAIFDVVYVSHVIAAPQLRWARRKMAIRRCRQLLILWIVRVKHEEATTQKGATSMATANEIGDKVAADYRLNKA